MLRMMLISIFALAVACSGGSTAPTQGDQDAGPDAAGDTDTSDNTETGDDCVCDDADSPCCDGCEAVDVGEPCDDGLVCTGGTKCTAHGQCASPDGLPCPPPDQPACQEVRCEEPDGCFYDSIRQHLDCDADGIQSGTGECIDGECVGEPCECDAESECCDGCMPINEGESCDDGDDRTFDDQCSGGSCTGTPCECSEGECCDGCQYLSADTVCEIVGDQRFACSEPAGECGGAVMLQEYQTRCTGDSTECGEPAWYNIEVHSQCEDTEACFPDGNETQPGCGWSSECN